jgi:hypothetical protein
MLVGFCTESVKGACQDTPPLPSTTSLQEDPSLQLYRGRSEGWSTTDEKPQLSSRSPSPDYTVGTRGRSTRGRDGPIHNLLEDHNIHGSSIRQVPTPRGSEDRSPSLPRRSKPSVARPLLGSPHSKSHPNDVKCFDCERWNFGTLSISFLHWCGVIRRQRQCAKNDRTIGMSNVSQHWAQWKFVL